MTEAMVKHEPQPMQMTPASVRAQVNLIQQVMKEVMQDGHHFGKIPGCGDKPALLKAGAEKLGMVFRLAPSFKIEIDSLEHGHREYRIVCTLTHIVTGDVWGQGVGSCSTLESKYRYRGAVGENTGAIVPKEYWDAKKAGNTQAMTKILGGPGHSTKKVDATWFIFKTTGEKMENPDIADQYNTVLKMAKKRAQVDATLTATAASDIFTQDIEEHLGDEPTETEKPRTAPKAPSKPTGPQSDIQACQDAFAEAGGDEVAWNRLIEDAEEAMECSSVNFDGYQWQAVMESIKLFAKAPKPNVKASTVPTKPFKAPTKADMDAATGFDQDAPF